MLAGAVSHAGEMDASQWTPTNPKMCQMLSGRGKDGGTAMAVCGKAGGNTFSGAGVTGESQIAAGGSYRSAGLTTAVIQDQLGKLAAQCLLDRSKANHVLQCVPTLGL
jgi:hypothetical protein